MLSRIKRVGWILKSFEIQESAKEADYKKLVSNEEMDIIYETLGKPIVNETVYTMFKDTFSGQSLSNGEDISETWKKLPNNEKNQYEKKFNEHRKDFKEQFSEYLLRLPEACRKSEIFNFNGITDVEKNDIYLMINRISRENDNSANEEMLKDKKRKKKTVEDVERDEEEGDDDEQTSPPKKAKKADKVDITNSKDTSSEETSKQLRKRSLSLEESEDESVSENKNRTSKKKKIQPAKDKKITKSKKNTKGKSIEEENKIQSQIIDELVGDEKIQTQKKTKNSKKDQTVAEENKNNSNKKNQSQMDEPVEEEENETQIKKKITIEDTERSSRNITPPEVTQVTKKKVKEPVIPPK